MRIAVSGGPAGLVFAVFVRLAGLVAEVTVWKRHRVADTYGFGAILPPLASDTVRPVKPLHPGTQRHLVQREHRPARRCRAHGPLLDRLGHSARPGRCPRSRRGAAPRAVAPGGAGGVRGGAPAGRGAHPADRSGECRLVRRTRGRAGVAPEQFLIDLVDLVTRDGRISVGDMTADAAGTVPAAAADDTTARACPGK